MARPANRLPALSLLLLLLLLPPPLLSLEAGHLRPTEGRLMKNCIPARRKCQADLTCNTSYHHLKSCTFGISTPTLPEDCLEAAQHLRNSPLRNCTCHRHRKNQTACLDIYSTVLRAHSLGGYELDASPSEDDTVTSEHWETKLSKLKMFKPDADFCLQFATLCTFDRKCDQLRKAYGKVCSGTHCQRQDCLQQLFAFFEEAPELLAQGILLCPCEPSDLSCGQRRRNTIAPSCALPSETPNCLELLHICNLDKQCRSRLDAFQTHCHPMDILGTCATEQSRCVQAYMGLIGTAMTPNFVSNISASVALSCTCRGSGNQQEDCEQLEKSFSHNPCLMDAIAVKMHLHKQLLSKNKTDNSTSPVMERQNLALRPRPWMPSLFSCILTLILLPSFC
ncbi:GDNF family receptor alpha-3 isoform X1 [Saccopteryx leptura]|uniref:GDNF family receptor alpha-3 isoform X1 n=1 Tax=Saccopteryx leptura TaxID=249018 RepID=UPI00339CA29A